MFDDGMAGDFEERLQWLVKLTKCRKWYRGTLGEVRDSGLNLVPREGPPTRSTALVVTGREREDRVAMTLGREFRCWIEWIKDFEKIERSSSLRWWRGGS
jgi:hypothetical protein